MRAVGFLACSFITCAACASRAERPSAQSTGGTDSSVGSSDGSSNASSSRSTPDVAAPSSGASSDMNETPEAGRGIWVAYASGYGPDIQLLAVDIEAGTLSAQASTPAFGSSPSFLAVDSVAANLYAIDESDAGRVGDYAIDPRTGELTFVNAISTGGEGPAFVATDRTGKYVFVANYMSGSVAILALLPNGSLGAVQQIVAVGVYPHMMIADPTNRFVFVPCKGSDFIAQFTFDVDSGMIAPNPNGATVATAPLAGPRHIAFDPTANFVYLVNETDSTISAYAYDPDAGTLATPPIDTLSTIEAGVTGNTAAEVWVHPSGRWALVSNRGENTLAVFAIDPSSGKMTFSERTPSGGAFPRDFTFDSTGTFVYAANQSSSTIVTFLFSEATGGLTQIATPIAATGVSFVGLAHIPGP
jgi:6-phosphogluconolactonase